jgi:2-dehydropantoate 2-reductase
MTMRILVVGAGAVGGYFGARLADAGRDVTFLVRARRAAELRDEGLQVVSPHGDLRIEPVLRIADQLKETYDVVFLSVKAYTLDQAIGDFASAVGKETMVLPMLNGMRHMDALKNRFGAHNIIGGACRIASELDATGRVVQLNPMQEVLYGELSGEVTPRIEALHATMSGAGFDAHIAADARQAMWDKWVQLAALGAITNLFRGSVGDVTAVADGRDLANAIITECATIVRACGQPSADEFIEAQRRAMTKEGSSFTSSMFRDLKKGQPVEAESIVGDMVARGRAHGIAAPLLTAAAVNLRVYQRSLAS